MKTTATVTPEPKPARVPTESSLNLNQATCGGPQPNGPRKEARGGNATLKGAGISRRCTIGVSRLVSYSGMDVFLSVLHRMAAFWEKSIPFQDCRRKVIGYCL